MQGEGRQGGWDSRLSLGERRGQQRHPRRAWKSARHGARTRGRRVQHLDESRDFVNIRALSLVTLVA